MSCDCEWPDTHPPDINNIWKKYEMQNKNK